MSKLFAVIKHHALRLLISLIILLFFLLHAIGAVEWNFINALENQAYDARLELTMPNTDDSRIVIVDIDEKSLSEMGRWPWNRSVMAHLDVAKEQFAKLSEQYPERLLYKLYAKRVEHFMENSPSENWNGVYTFTSK